MYKTKFHIGKIKDEYKKERIKAKLSSKFKFNLEIPKNKREEIWCGKIEQLNSFIKKHGFEDHYSNRYTEDKGLYFSNEEKTKIRYCVGSPKNLRIEFNMQCINLEEVSKLDSLMDSFNEFVLSKN
jgi:hypothetical protein